MEASNDQGYDVFWITAGEWLEYTFEAEESANYTISPYVASVPGFGNFKLLIDNIDVSGKQPVLGTGGWQFWKPVEIKDVTIEAGVHIMRLEFDSDSDKTGWLFSLNYIEVVKSSPAGIAVPDKAPRVFKLHQNHPNPFNPVTVISWQLAAASAVELNIYDITGAKVVTLLKTNLGAGDHRYRFNGTNLASGVYYYHLVAGEFQQVRKMVLIK